jgi:hypothetical protein
MTGGGAVSTKYTPRPAQRSQSKLRMALCGPSGAGKTFTALRFAAALGGQVCVIDAERGSSQKYVGVDGVPPFDVIVLETFGAEEYISAIEAADGYDVLIIDSISPEWVSILELVDAVTASSHSHNAYTEGWRVATPKHNQFINAMLQYPGHLLASIRMKTKYILVDTGQGQAPKKAGWELQQRDYLEFEFDLIAEMDHAHSLEVVKTRCPELDGVKVRRPGPEFMTPIKAWLGTGRRVYSVHELIAAVKAAGFVEDDLRARMTVVAPGTAKIRDLRPHEIEMLMESFLPASVNGAPA